jgi:hypothetical protein
MVSGGGVEYLYGFTFRARQFQRRLPITTFEAEGEGLEPPCPCGRTV